MTLLRLLFLIGLSLKTVTGAVTDGKITCPVLNCNPKLDASTCF